MQFLKYLQLGYLLFGEINVPGTRFNFKSAPPESFINGKENLLATYFSTFRGFQKSYVGKLGC